MKLAGSISPETGQAPRGFFDEPMHGVQIECFRKMSIAQKFDAITAMREMSIKPRIVGLRMRQADWSGENLEIEARKAAMYASTD